MKNVLWAGVLAVLLSGCESLPRSETRHQPPPTYDNPLDALGELTEGERKRIQQHIEQALEEQRKKEKEKGCWFTQRVRTCDI